MKGLQLWVMTLISYDGVGNATVLKSFSKVAKESGIQQRAKAKASAKPDIKSKQTGEVNLF